MAAHRQLYFTEMYYLVLEYRPTVTHVGEIG